MLVRFASVSRPMGVIRVEVNVLDRRLTVRYDTKVTNEAVITVSIDTIIRNIGNGQRLASGRSREGERGRAQRGGSERRADDRERSGLISGLARSPSITRGATLTGD